MDQARLIEALKATLIPEQREQAEAYMKEVYKIINFAPLLLKLVMSEEIEMSVRQAGAIYLKNTIQQNWEEREPEKPGDPITFCIHDSDKQLIRANILQSIINSQNPIRIQLALCVSSMVKHDYPGKWPDIAGQVLQCLTSDQHNTWHGALICLHQLCKNFEYKKTDDREPLNEVMKHMLPILHGIGVNLLSDQSEASVQIQKLILKCFYTLIQFIFPLNLITNEMFTTWMELLRQILDRPVPPECDQVEKEERADLIWWKCKKWALHIVTRTFERYGSPGNVLKEYTTFSEWYIRTFSGGVIDVLMRILSSYQNQQFVSSRVLQLTLTYLINGVGHALTWKLMKPHIQNVIENILFPLLCHNEEDEELWHSDPVEYIRVKYDIYEEFFSPTNAAQNLLHTVAARRKDCLQKTMVFVVGVMTGPPDGVKKSGALHVVGSLAEVLIKKKLYKAQIEPMLVSQVIPHLASEFGFLRAKACWVVGNFSELTYQNTSNLDHMLSSCRNILTKDTELPVKIEAAITLQKMLQDQVKATDLLKPHIRQIVLDLLTLVRDTENDDITGVITKFVCVYTDEIMPLAVEISSHLAQTFGTVIEGCTGDAVEDKSVTAMGLLHTMETICQVLEEQKDVLLHVEVVIAQVVVLIVQKETHEFYEEMFALTYSLTCPHVTLRMWEIFPLLAQLFLKKENMEYFNDLMPTLHNYVTVDPNAFLSDASRIHTTYSLIKSVLADGPGEDAECHAAKLIEVILLQFPAAIAQMAPQFMELVFERLARQILTTELRTMLLQTILAALYVSPDLMLQILNSTATVINDVQQPMIRYYITQLIEDSECFFGIHDRRMLILGMCTLLGLPIEKRPPPLLEVAPQILPSLVLAFNCLKKAYEHQNEESDSEHSQEDSEGEGELEDEDDVIEDETNEYMDGLKKVDGDSDSEFSEDEDDETDLESFETLIDKDESRIEEYQIFRTVLEEIHVKDPQWYAMLTMTLSDDNKKDLEEIFKLAEQKKAAEESKMIEQSGGYSFTNIQVPTSFCFGNNVS